FTLVDARSLAAEDRSALYFKMGYSLFILKEFEQASVLFNETRETRDKYYYPANYYYGMTQYFQGNFSEAISSFEKVAPSDYYKDYIPYYITQIHFNRKEYQKVIGYGNQVIASPTVQNKTEIRHLVGQAYFETNDYEAALPHLQYVEKNSSKLRTEDFYQLGMAYYHAGRYTEAIPVLLEIRNETGIQPHYANYYLGQAYLKTGDKTSARNSLRNAMLMEDVPTVSTEATFHYGRLSAEAGDDGEAIRVLQTIPPSSPDYNEAQRTLANILTNTSDYSLAIRELEAIGKLTTTLQEAYQKVTLYRAEQLIQESKSDEAGPLLDKSLKYPVNKSIQSRALFWKGELAHLNNQYNESIKWYNQYFTIAEKLNDLPAQQSVAVAHYNQGYNYLKLSDFIEGQRHFEAAVNGIELISSQVIGATFVKNQIWPDALLRAGDASFKRNQYDKANQYYDQSIKNKYPGYDYAKFQKALIKGLQKKPQEKIALLEELSNGKTESLWADDALFETGNTYEDEHQIAKAIASYERLVSEYKQSSPLLLPAIIKLGLISYNSQQFENALKYYKSIFQYNPDPATSREAMSAIQEIYVNELDKPEAFFAYAGSIPGYTVSGNERDSILYSAAENHYAQGNYDKAAESFKNYLDQNPKGAYSLKAKYLRAESLSLAKRWEDALASYETVIKEGPSSYLSTSLYKAALISYNQKQDMQRAYRYYSDYIPLAESEEQQYEAMLGALRSAYKMKNDADVNRMTAEIVVHPRATDDIRALAHYYSAMLAYDADDYERAISAFNSVIRINSAELAAESRYYIASIYYKKGENALAEKLAEESARTNVGYPVWVARSLILLSDVQFAKGDLLNARAIIEAIIENFQGDAAIIREATQRLERIKKEEENQNRVKPSNGDTLEMTEPKKD
ncbi:MAG: tetratricopeptide repeat protein, partial [Bacteroidota bacterium]|nr:tetratricopeptide repeat protein [Bacteroidota bacterium]